MQVQIGDYRDVVDLMSTIDSLPRPSGGTNIHEALQKMRDMFKVDHRFDGKPYKRLIAIVITDGVDEQPSLVQSTASEAHADGIVVISIGKKRRLTICPGKFFTLVINHEAIPSPIDYLVPKQTPHSTIGPTTINLITKPFQ